MSDILKSMVRETVITQPPSSWPTYNGKTQKRRDFITASEAGKCLRNLSFDKNAEANTVPVDNYWGDMTEEKMAEVIASHGDEDKLGIFARGHNVEAWVVAQLRANLDETKERVELVGDEQISFYSKKARVSGTPDGVYFDLENHTMSLIEIKSAVSRVSQPRYTHKTQVLVNMGLISYLIQIVGDKKFAKLMGWKFALKNGKLPTWAGGQLLYIDPSNYFTMQEFTVDYDGREVFVQTARRAAQLFKKTGDLRKPEKLPPEGLANRGCYFCGHKHACGRIEHAAKNAEHTEALRTMLDGGKPVMPALPTFQEGDKVEAIAVVLDAYVDAGLSAKSYENVKKDIRPAVEDFMDHQDNDVIEFSYEYSQYKVSWTNTERKGAFDEVALSDFLQEHHPNMTAELFRKPSSNFMTLRVSKKELPND